MQIEEFLHRLERFKVKLVDAGSLLPARLRSLDAIHIATMRQLAADREPARAARALGIVQTTWVEMQDFITAWHDRIPPVEKQPAWQRNGDFPWKAAARSAAVFRKLSEAWR